MDKVFPNMHSSGTRKKRLDENKMTETTRFSDQSRHVLSGNRSIDVIGHEHAFNK